MKGIKNWILNWVYSMIESFDQNVAKSALALSEDIFSGELYEVAKKITEIIKPIALNIIVICFLIEFLKLTIKMDILKWEFGLRCFLKFILSKSCIDISFKFLEAIYATAARLIMTTGATIPTMGSSTLAVMKEITEKYKWYDALGLAVTMALPMLCIWVVGILINVMAYARMFELLIYIAVSPLPCAFLPLEDQGSGSRIPRKFFFNFAGVCLQGLFMLVSIQFYNILCSSQLVGALKGTSDVGTVAYNMLLGSLVLIMSVIKSGQWAKSLLDAM